MAFLTTGITFHWWFGREERVVEVLVHQLCALLLPVPCALCFWQISLQSNVVSEIYIIGIYSVPFVLGSKGGYVGLISEELVCFFRAEMEASLHEQVPYSHPLREISYRVNFCFFQQQGGLLSIHSASF